MINDKDKKSELLNFIKSKGLYAALFLCIAAVGAGTWGVINKSSKIEEENSPNPQSIVRSEPDTANRSNSEKQVNKPVENERDDRSGKNADSANENPTEPASMASNNLNKPFESLYVMPAGNNIIKDFSGGELVYSKTMDDWRTHDGIDFKADEGTQVKAINDGIVLRVYKDEMWGNVMEIDHGSGLVAKYCGLADEFNAKAGDSVAINGVIGALAAIPCESADGVHLHLEIRIGSTLTDPLEAMGKANG